jgi:hypothetical protein
MLINKKREVKLLLSNFIKSNLHITCTPHFSFLNYSQYLCLMMRIKVSYFIKKNRAISRNSKQPIFSVIALVNELLPKPNSSASNSSSGIFPQFITTNGLYFLPLYLRINLTINSFPANALINIKIFLSQFANLRTNYNCCLMAWHSPMILMSQKIFVPHIFPIKFLT